jgi:hypothetical protein
MHNLLLDFSDVQIRPKVGVASEAAIRQSDVMEEVGRRPSLLSIEVRITNGVEFPSAICSTY